MTTAQERRNRKRSRQGKLERNWAREMGQPTWLPRPEPQRESFFMRLAVWFRST